MQDHTANHQKIWDLKPYLFSSRSPDSAVSYSNHESGTSLYKPNMVLLGNKVQLHIEVSSIIWHKYLDNQ